MAREQADIEPSGIRRAELLAALSLAIDLGLGLPMEHMLRSSLLSRVLAERLGMDDKHWACVYYTNLVLWIGCHADSHEFSRWFGDDIAFRRNSYEVDWSGLPYLGLLLRSVGSGQPLGRRARTLLTLAMAPRTRLAALIHSHCLSAGLLAESVGLDRDVCTGIGFSFERWDGGGLPTGCRGEAIPLATRVVQLAEVTEVHVRAHGVSGALTMARARSGKQFDPDLVAVLLDSEDKLRQLPEQQAWTSALAQAPDNDQFLTGTGLDEVLQAMGDFADLKCPFTVGHSRAVARLAGSAATDLGLSEAEARRVRRAGYVHDLGRMAVPNSVWEKTGPLSESDRERIRLHPYLSGRILRRVRGLDVEADLAETHHERQDGSGYPRGSHGSALGIGNRVLAAADSYQTSTELRPHRPALGPTAAADRLREQARSGALDAGAVDAVLTAAGHRARRRGSWPAGLTSREVGVLALLARGLSTREIAAQLTISTKTVRNHLEHIYAKLGVSNRVGAGLFAVRQGLLGGSEDGADAP